MAEQQGHKRQHTFKAYRGRRHTPSSVTAGVIGNVMEWYDFALYGFFAPVISQLFFPSQNHIASLIATFGVFAMGFFMRPLGGVIFGWIGDRHGRALVLKLSVVTMGTATFLIGILPTHAQIGFWGALLLLVVRLLQGLSVGGEFSGSVTYMVETSPTHKRGYAGSWANFGSMAGTLLGSGLAALVTTVFARETVDHWAWRLPFIIGGLMAAVAFAFVRNVDATPHMDHHESQHQENSPLREALTRDRKSTFLAIVFASGYGIFFYIPLVYLPTYASEIGHFQSSLALQINSAGIALCMPLIPLFGWISDRFLRRRTLLIIGFGVTAACGWGLVLLSGATLSGLAAGQLILAALTAIPMGAAPAMLVELFPVEDRLTGYSLAYNLGLGIAGGTAPMVATWLIAVSGVNSAPGAYLMGASIIAAIALWFMRDRSRELLR